MKERLSAIFLLVLSMIGYFSCTNNDPIKPIELLYDTIKPLSYFPVFPGSYWEYVDSSDHIIIKSADSTYKKDYYIVGEAAYISDTFYVPYYEGTPIWGYEAHTGPISHSGSYPFTRILSDTLPEGSSWNIYHWSGTGVSRKIIAKDTIITVLGIEYYPTIVIEEYYSTGPPFYLWIAKRYYTENIGLIKEEQFSFPDSNIYTLQLSDYHINN